MQTEVTVVFLNPAVAGQYAGRTFASDRDTASTGQWYHLAYTGDGSTARLYVDGAEVDSEPLALTTTNTWNQPLNLGRYFTGTSTAGGHLDGRMDDVRVYNRKLTQAEITHLATSRGIEGGPSGPPSSVFYNPFKSHAFHNRFFGNDRNN